MFKGLNVDPSKVNNIYALLTVFLLASEGLLGFWFSQGKFPAERIVAGILMTIILLGFLFLIFKLAKEKAIINPVPTALNDTLNTAQKEVSIEEIKIIGAEQISGPEGTYTINAPPNHWILKTVSMSGLVLENFGINDSNLGNVQEASPITPENILLLKSNYRIEIVPIPGKTIINGTMIPTALMTNSPLQLAIIPFERLQPPFYSENSFEHNVFKYAGEILKTGVVKMQNQIAGKIPGSGRDFIQIEFIQELEHVDMLINEQRIADCPRVHVYTNLIAIKGDIIDHFLLMNYPTITNDISISFLENELNELKSLVNSFKPLKIKDPLKLLSAIKEKGKINCANVIKQSGFNMFMSEFYIVLRRLELNDATSLEDKKMIINNLRPFQDFYQLLNEKDDQFDDFWLAFAEAEKGNFENLLDQLEDFLDDIEDIANEDRQNKLLNSGGGETV